jgi:hypothetical protein
MPFGGYVIIKMHFIKMYTKMKQKRKAEAFSIFRLRFTIRK